LYFRHQWELQELSSIELRKRPSWFPDTSSSKFNGEWHLIIFIFFILRIRNDCLFRHARSNRVQFWTNYSKFNDQTRDSHEHLRSTEYATILICFQRSQTVLTSIISRNRIVFSSNWIFLFHWLFFDGKSIFFQDQLSKTSLLRHAPNVPRSGSGLVIIQRTNQRRITGCEDFW